MSRVVITLNQNEREALVKLALVELRTPRDQARHILRLVLQQYGLLEKVRHNTDRKYYDLRDDQTYRSDNPSHSN